MPLWLMAFFIFIRVGAMTSSTRVRSVRLVVTSLALSAVTLGMMWLPSGASSLGAPLMTGSAHLTLRSQSVIAPGIVRTTWTFPGGSVSSADLTGSSVSAGCTGQPGSRGSCWSSTGPTSLPKVVRYYSQKQNARLVYLELRALGASKSVADSMARSTLPPGTPFAPPSGTEARS